MTGAYDSPIGHLTIVSDGGAVTAVRISREQDICCNEDAPIRRMKVWLDDYFSGHAPSPVMLPLQPHGTPFQQLVWSLLLQIPYGEARSYGELSAQAAKLLGKERMSARAIGGAVGRNPILIAIPCHRILGGDGSLTGFSAGIDKKIILLEHERISFR